MLSSYAGKGLKNSNPLTMSSHYSSQFSSSFAVMMPRAPRPLGYSSRKLSRYCKNSKRLQIVMDHPGKLNNNTNNILFCVDGRKAVMYAFGILEHPLLGEVNLIGGRKFRHAWSGSVSGTRRGVHVFFF